MSELALGGGVQRRLEPVSHAQRPVPMNPVVRKKVAGKLQIQSTGAAHSTLFR